MSPSRFSSRIVESKSASESLSLKTMSSFTSAQPCFCMRLYRSDILFSTSSRRLSDMSVREFRSEISERMSSSSARQESIRSESSAAAGMKRDKRESCLPDSLSAESNERTSPPEDAEVKSSSTVQRPVLISSALASCFCSTSSSSSSPSRRDAASS